MKVVRSRNRDFSEKKAAKLGAELISLAINKNGRANILVECDIDLMATLRILSKKDIDWNKVAIFLAGDLIGPQYKGHISKYIENIFAGIQICQETSEEIDVCFCTIGENSSLVFNCGPNEDNDYNCVILDLARRKQLLGEQLFGSLEEVPDQAFCASVPFIMRSKAIVCFASGFRKAEAVKACLEGPVTNDAPASFIQQHNNAVVFLDNYSSLKLLRS